MMTTTQIANDFTDLCRTHRNLEAIDKYYSPTIVSQESMSAPGMAAEMTGIDAVRAKNQWWLENHEIHSSQVNGPYVGEDQFALEFAFDVTAKATGHRMQMNEMALYTLKGGKVVHEHFYYKTS